MQAHKQTRMEWGSWRLPLLAAAVLLIILVPASVMFLPDLLAR